MIRWQIEAVGDLSAHARIPSRFTSASAFDVTGPPQRPVLRERQLAVPTRKDYDAIEDPLRWPRDFDTRHWVLIAAVEGGVRLAGVIGATNTAGVDMLEGRDDLAVLWDLRVTPEARRRGIATSLLLALEQWARDNRCRELKVETQNTNVAACHVYEAAGFTLSEAHFDAYPAFPHEVQLIWRKRIDG